MPRILRKALHDLDSTEGTVQLRRVRGNVDSLDQSLILVPHPSEHDPNDPLRWPRWKKHAAFASILVISFLTNFGLGGLAPAFYILSKQFDKTPSETSDLIIWPVFVLGAFNFFWVPLGNYFGKRPVFVLASGLLCLCFVWGAVATSFRSLLWSNIVASFAGSSTEALGASVVNDLYFVHERSHYMSLYVIAISGGNTVGPLLCGFIVTGLSWRWFKWLSVILTGLSFVSIVLLVPETRYNRDVSKAMGSVEVASRDDLADGVTADQKATATAHSAANSNEVQQLPKMTWIRELSLWSGTAKDTNLIWTFIRPLPLIVYPAVIFAFISYAVTLAWVVAINVLNPFVLQGPPYNWKPSVNGLINIAGLLGNLFGAFTGGWVVDRYSDYRTKRNGGVFEPEYRLVMLMIPTILVPAGCILFGYGVEETLNWTSLFFGYGMVAVGLSAVPVIGMTYVSDCYYAVAPDALLVVNGLKNMVCFGFLYGIVPWVTDVGYVAAYWTQAAIMIFVMAVGALPLYFFGERIRHSSAKWRVIL